jgi:NADPH-dependent 2,4-dienoyl-CoA reductase/sulfur reductase-like enzyme
VAKVCVIGAGSAGVEAATEAARRGADVTLFEKTEAGIPPKISWPDFILSPQSLDASRHRVPADGSIDAEYSNPVLYVRERSVTTSEGSRQFDKIVVATGSTHVLDGFPGFRKPGVVTLDSFSGFRELCARMCSISDAVVVGEGLRSLRVADSLCGESRRVSLARPCGTMLKELSPKLDSILLTAAARAGVRITGAPVQRAFGYRKVEAVVAGGDVIPCDTVAVVPGEIPDFPGGIVRVGPRGGLLVDQQLKSEEKGLFAAGSCAELVGPGFVAGISLRHSAESSGRIAGANAAGEKLLFNPIGAYSCAVFGHQVSWAGLSLREAKFQGFDVSQATTREGGASGCSLVFDRCNGRVIGIQTVEASGTDMSPLFALLISQRIGIRALAYGDLSSSTDISPISEAARMGLTAEAHASG